MSLVPLPFASASAPLIGAVHLPPLPGSPRWSAGGRPPLDAILARALEDARAYAAAGFDGVIVENFGDAPFFKVAPPETLALLTRCAREVVSALGELPVGVNLLRNDAHGALACALAAGARFARVNVHTSAAVTDQGLIEGRAAETLRLREALGAGPGGPHPVALCADVHVKHARPLAAGETLLEAAHDAAERGLADALILSGVATGSAPEPELLASVRAALPDLPLWLGSGLKLENAALLRPHLRGAIAGSAAEEGGRAGNPVDPARAAALVAAWRSAG